MISKRHIFSALRLLYKIYEMLLLIISFALGVLQVSFFGIIIFGLPFLLMTYKQDRLTERDKATPVSKEKSLLASLIILIIFCFIPYFLGKLI